METQKQIEGVGGPINKEYLKILDPVFFSKDVSDFNGANYRPGDESTSTRISDISKRHRVFMDVAGIELIPHVEDSPFNFGSGPDSYVRLGYRIADGAKIATYLDAQAEIIKSAIMGRTEAVDDMPLQDRNFAILGLLVNIRYELDKLTNLDDEDGYVLSIAINIKRIVKSFEPIAAYVRQNNSAQIKDFLAISGIKDIAECIEKLRSYDEHMQNGDFKEYLMARELFLDRPFADSKEEFVLNWHKNTNPERLKQAWESVLRTIHDIAENRRSGKLYAQALETAKDAVRNAIEEVTAWKDKALYRDSYLVILNEAEATLKKF